MYSNNYSQNKRLNVLCVCKIRTSLKNFNACPSFIPISKYFCYFFNFFLLTWLFSLRHLPQFSFLHGLQNQGLKSNLNFHTEVALITGDFIGECTGDITLVSTDEQSNDSVTGFTGRLFDLEVSCFLLLSLIEVLFTVLNSITVKYKKDNYKLRLKYKMKKNLIGFRNKQCRRRLKITQIHR
ncbi:hypothetical protein AGLY_004110 [Aphis glycines]|uniref:Uncharacterized protein n=1 Tax=Aphis glycines TaxID=307491 RepID=A0A6G0TXA7_APHGL|nr:hypothetical protein AGLY_004110 [Aphis glycines]